MSTEHREIRPYDITSELQSVFAGCQLHLGAEHCCPGENLQIDPETFLSHEPILQFVPDAGTSRDFVGATAWALEHSKLEPDDVALTLSVRSHFLKLSDLLYSRQVSKLASPFPFNLVTDADTNGRSPALSARFHGCDISLRLVLLREGKDHHTSPANFNISSAPQGYWLAEAIFSLQYHDHHNLYHIEPLTEEARALLEERRIVLHPATLRFLDIKEPEDLLAPITDLNIPTLWLDERVHQHLSRSEDSPISKTCEHELFCYFIDTVVHTYATLAQDLKLSSGVGDAISPESVIWRVMRYCVGGTPSDEDIVSALSQAQSNPAAVAANIEGRSNLLSQVQTTLGA